MLRLLWFFPLTLFVAATHLIADGWEAFGKGMEGERLVRAEASPNWRDGVFVNGIPLFNPFLDRPERWFDSSEHAVPHEPLAVHTPDPASCADDPGTRITWFGHSIVLIETAGVRFLTDPVWAKRVSPYTWIGPERWYQPPVALHDLPPIDAVLISHDHYDHLDMETIKGLKERAGSFIVPLGVGEHLAYWGIPDEKIIELDWWDEHVVEGVRVVATPARHASGRMIIDNDRTLWMGFAILGVDHSIYFSGDTGLFPEMKDISDQLGPFDVTMIEVGAYGADWPDWHIGPEQAVLAPRPGITVHLDQPEAEERWWPGVPWQSAEEAPITATGEFDRAFRSKASDD